ncbi:MAG: hypothetical protein WDO71_27075 [Bacteroidota bacterium]
MYYIKQRQDSAAKVVLTNIINLFTKSPLAAKAATMLDVLNRRQQIEEELRNLVINRPAEDTTTRFRQEPVVINNTQQPAVPKDTLTIQKPVSNHRL